MSIFVIIWCGRKKRNSYQKHTQFSLWSHYFSPVVMRKKSTLVKLIFLACSLRKQPSFFARGPSGRTKRHSGRERRRTAVCAGYLACQVKATTHWRITGNRKTYTYKWLNDAFPNRNNFSHRLPTASLSKRKADSCLRSAWEVLSRVIN